MIRARTLLLAAALLSSCTPPVAWGGDEAIKTRLLAAFPIGTSIDQVEAEAARRKWRQIGRGENRPPKGAPHYFDDCQFQGGPSRLFIVAEYGILPTTIESLFLFDARRRLAGLCIRRTTDAL